MKNKTISTLTILGLLISGAAMSEPLTVNAKTNNEVGYKRVIGFHTDDSLLVSSMALINKTGAFRVVRGDCHKTKMALKQQVFCVSSSGGVVTAQLGNSSIVLGSYDDKRLLADKIYKLADDSSLSPILSKIGYVGKTSSGLYRLYTASFDGDNEKLLFESDMPILSPSFSSDGRYITYVSFEDVRSGVYVYDTERGQRIKAVSIRGLNGYPSFKDNHTLLISMSKEKVNSDIYEFNILNKKLKQLTWSVEPEIYPKYMNGDLYYVKMFGDTPYIYKKDSGGEQKVFNTPHNTPSVSALNGAVLATHGNEIVLKEEGLYRVIYKNDSIESPTIDKSGQLIYATVEEGEGFYIVAINKYGEPVFRLKKKSENIIQVVAN